MAMTALNPEKWVNGVQDYLNNMHVGEKICQIKSDYVYASGDQVNFPYTDDVFAESYTPGNDLVGQSTSAVQSSVVIDQVPTVSVTIDYTQQAQAEANYELSYIRQSAYRLRDKIDQYVINKGVSEAANTTAISPNLTVNTIQDLCFDAETELSRNNATDGPLFALMGPQHKNLLAKTFIANGFNRADSVLSNGYVGDAYGFSCYATNNLPSTATLTLATTPTASDTVTVAGVTFKFVAAPSAAKDVDLGTDAASSLANLANAVNGGTGAGTAYIALSVKDRNKLINKGVSMNTTTGVTTGYGHLGVSAVMTATTNLWGTETSSILFGRKGAISLAIQKQPNMIEDGIPNQLAKKVKTWTLFGSDVFYRDTFRLFKATVNSATS